MGLLFVCVCVYKAKLVAEGSYQICKFRFQFSLQLISEANNHKVFYLQLLWPYG